MSSLPERLSSTSPFNLPFGALAALFFGTVLSSVLFGIAILQAYIYFRNFKDDRRIHKISVVVLVLLNAATFGMTIAGAWALINTLRMVEPHWVNAAFRDQLAVTGIMFSFLQSLYWYRIWCLRRSLRMLPLCIALFVAVGWVTSLAFGLILLDLIPTTEGVLIFILKWWPVITAFNDVLIAATLCYYLRRARFTEYVGDLPWTRLLLRWIFSSGLFTSILSIGMVISLYTMPGLETFFVVTAVISRLYVNSFLSMLNIRPRKGEQAGKLPTPREEVSV